MMIVLKSLYFTEEYHTHFLKLLLARQQLALPATNRSLSDC